MSKTDAERLHIEVTPKEGEVRILHGELLKPEPPVPINIDGGITSPENFWKMRGKDYDPQKCYVIVNDNVGLITLVLNDSDPHENGFVKGRIELHDETERWGINDVNKSYTNRELLKLAKANEYLFPKKEEWTNLVTTLNTFDASVNMKLIDHKATQGDMEKAIQITLKKDVPEKFTLNAKIYGERQLFVVYLGAEIKGQSVDFFLDSSDLARLLSSTKDELLKKHSEIFEDKLVVIYE